MQRSLFLVRHAKALDSSQGQKDFDRELSSVGRTDAIHMGRYLYNTYPNPELIISSSAMRARDTAQALAEQMHFSVDKIQVSEDLYEASVRTLMALVCEIDSKFKSVMIVAHNPVVSYFAEYLTGAEVGNMAPSGVVMIRLENLQWQEVSEANCKFVQYHEPEQ